MEKWGYIREDSEEAKKAGTDKDTGLHRTGLEVYLATIFPEINDWVHDKTIPNLIRENGKHCLSRPDYYSPSQKIIVEFDGLPHYTNPDNIKKDTENTKFYETNGFKVYRIPYFIQLTNEVVKKLFGREVNETLFNPQYASIGVKGNNSPAYLCIAGIYRMAKEFKEYPQQYEVNINYLKEKDPNNETYWKLLEELYNGKI